MNKIFSGRYLWCLISALVFLILSVNKTLPADKVTEIVLVIVMAYFGKARNDGGKNA
jgi:amino acid permease